MQPPKSTHVRTNAVKTSNTALQDQELLPAAQSGQTARKTGRENSTQIRPPETIRNRPQAGSVYITMIPLLMSCVNPYY